MDNQSTSDRGRKSDLAAQAAWLYYIAGCTQDEVAAKMNISRQAAQRLVALAVSEGLIRFRLDHPIIACAQAAETLRARYGLTICDVVLTAEAASGPTGGLSVAVAEQIESFLSSRTPVVLGVSTGRTLAAAVAEVPPMNRPEHKIVSVVGTMSRDGRASHYEVSMRLAQRTGAECYPMPTPVVATSVEERKLLQTQRSYMTIRGLTERAVAVFVGICGVGWGCTLHRDGFITESEVAELVELGGVGEIAGSVFDENGRAIAGSINDRVAGLSLSALSARPVIGVGCGSMKVSAIRGALRGGLLHGLITDLDTALALAADEGEAAGRQVRRAAGG